MSGFERLIAESRRAQAEQLEQMIGATADVRWLHDAELGVRRRRSTRVWPVVAAAALLVLAGVAHMQGAPGDDAEVSIGREPAATAGEPELAERPAVRSVEAEAPVPAPPSKSAPPSPVLAEPAPPAPTWQELAARGQHGRALALVQRLGFSTVLAQSGPEDLLSLAEVSRFTRHPDLARQALLALRDRHPGDARASLAAYSLGRMTAGSTARVSEAVSWFETYLREQPGGSLAREAFGRLLELHGQSGHTAKARQLARAYLQRYPTGPHATYARQLLDASR